LCRNLYFITKFSYSKKLFPKKFFVNFSAKFAEQTLFAKQCAPALGIFSSRKSFIALPRRSKALQKVAIMSLDPSYRIQFPVPIFAMSFSKPNPNSIVTATLTTESENFISVYSLDTDKGNLQGSSEPFKFPATCAKFCPSHIADGTEHLLSGNDALHLWSVTGTEITHRYARDVNRSSHPITCLDWGRSGLIAYVACSNGIVSIFDIGLGECISAVVAHDYAVHDVCSAGSDHVFLTAGFDGSMRQFDSRDMSSFSVVYQSATPLLRLSVCPQDNEKVALIGRQSTGVALVDRRQPGVPLAASPQGENIVTGIDWGKKDRKILFSVNDAGEFRRAEYDEEIVMLPTDLLFSGEVPAESVTVGERYAAVSYGCDVAVFPI
jgi:WD40 repeat protein